MKQCPRCKTTYTDESLKFCLQDGVLLNDKVRIPNDSQAETIIIPDDSDEDPEEKGLLDYLLDIELAFEEINRIAMKYGADIDIFNTKIAGHAARMQACNDNPSQGTARQKYQIALLWASDMNLFAKKIEDELPSFEKNADMLDESLTGWINLIPPAQAEDKEKILSGRQLFINTSAKMNVSIEGFRALREVVINLIGVSKDVNRASRRLAKAFDSFILNVEKVNAFSEKAVSLIDNKFGDLLNAK